MERSYLQRVALMAVAIALLVQAHAVAQNDTQKDVSQAAKCYRGGEQNASYEQIQKLLSRRLEGAGLEITEQTLDHVCELLRGEYDLPIQIDHAALDDAGLTINDSVTIFLKPVSLRSALRLILKPKGLTYVIQNEVLIITTTKVAESELVASVYNVHDIVGDDANKMVELANAIKSSVGRQSWSPDKGEGDIKLLQNGLLVISQTTAMHEQIQDLLASIMLAREELSAGGQMKMGGGGQMKMGGGGEMKMGGGYGMLEGGMSGGGMGMSGNEMTIARGSTLTTDGIRVISGSRGGGGFVKDQQYVGGFLSDGALRIGTALKDNNLGMVRLVVYPRSEKDEANPELYTLSYNGMAIGRSEAEILRSIEAAETPEKFLKLFDATPPETNDKPEP